MSFVFYDTETTGISAPFDQILQFAAIRTDSDFNEIERFEIRCRLLPYVVPAPGAMHTTKITVAQLTDPLLPSHYEMVRKIREKFLSWSPCIFVGYNSLEFDENLLRQALYKTLHSPYLTNMKGCSRSDVMKIGQAISLFCPDAVKFPKGNKTPLSFKLGAVAAANGIDLNNAHDAMADVEATISLCKLFMSKAPEVWSTCMRLSQKAAAIDYVNSENIFCFAGYNRGRSYASIVTPIGSNSENPAEFYVYDLSINPEDLSSLSDEKLASRLNKSPKPIKKLKCNSLPMLMTAAESLNITSAKEYQIEELENRAEFLRSNANLKARLISMFENSQPEWEESPHVEEQIYKKFYDKEDEKLLEEFHNVPWEQRFVILNKLKDDRLKTMGLKLIYVERPDLFNEAASREHNKVMIISRLLGANDNSRWMTLQKAIQEIEELMAANPDSIEFLVEHKRYLLERLQQAEAAV